MTILKDAFKLSCIDERVNCNINNKLKSTLDRQGFGFLWLEQSPEDIKINYKDIVNRAINQAR